MSDMRVPHSTAPLVSIPSGGTAADAARRYDPRLGAPMQRGTDTVDAFGSSSSRRPLAQGFADVAQATQAVVRKTLQEEAETRAADAYATFGAELSGYVDNDIFNRKGQNAFGAVGDVAEFAKDAESRLSKDMNEATRKIFSAQAAQFRFGVQSRVAAYEGGERRQARFDSMKSAAALEFELAVRNSGDERLFAEGKARGLRYVAEMSDMAGHDAATKALYLQKAAGEYDAGRIARFVAAGSLDRAFGLLADPSLSETQRAEAASGLRDARLRELEATIQTDPQGSALYLDALKARLNNGGDPQINAAIAASPDSLLNAADLDRLTRTRDLAASKQRKDAAFQLASTLSPEEMQARLASPEGLGIPGLSMEEGAEVAGRLAAHRNGQAARKQAEERSLEKELLDSAWKAFIEDPATAFDMIANSNQPDERKGPMLAAIVSGRAGKADDPAFTTKIFSDIAAGRFDNENDLTAAMLCGNMTKETAEQATRLHRLMQSPQGRLLRPAFERLAGLAAGLDPAFGATALADAQSLFMQAIEGAKTPAELAELVDPQAAGDAVGRSWRIASANAGLEAGTLYADAGAARSAAPIGAWSDEGGFGGLAGEHLSAEERGEVVGRGVTDAGGGAMDARGLPGVEVRVPFGDRAQDFSPETAKDMATGLGHGAVDGLNEAVQCVYEYGEKLRKHMPEWMDYSLNWDFRPDENGRVPGFSLDTGAPLGVPQIPNAFPAPSTPEGAFAGKLAQFLTGYFAGGQLLKGVKVASRWGRFAKAELQSAISNFAFFDAHEQRFADLIQDSPLANPYSEYVAGNIDESDFEGRTKNVLDGLGCGILAEGVFTVARSLRLARKARGAGETARPQGSLTAQALEGVGLKARRAEAAMYRARESTIVDFVNRVSKEGGKADKSFFTLRPQKGVLQHAREVIFPSDTALHKSKRHPNMTDIDMERLLQVVEELSPGNTGIPKIETPRMAGRPHAGWTIINGEAYGIIYEVTKNQRVVITTYFKDTPQSVRSWFTNFIYTKKGVVTPAAPPAPAQVP